MIESQRQEILAELTLPLSNSAMPFALEGREIGFGSDDWAWLFLRMNADYKKAYREEKEREADENIELYLVNPANHHIRTDLDGSCMRRFGLAAWLNPHEEELPRLKNNGSWFFPLKRPVFEDYQRNVVDDTPYTRIGPMPNMGV